MKEAKDYNPSKDPRLINCKTECGNGKCYARRYGLFAEKTCPNFVEPKPITNADRVRSMTDEELAEWITELTDCTVYPHTRKDAPSISIGQTCAASWLDWLKQEASE